jgi:hypothetical protein
MWEPQGRKLECLKFQMQQGIWVYQGKGGDNSNANVEFLFLSRPPARPQSLQLQNYLQNIA